MPVKLRRRILAIAVCLALIAPSYAQSVPIAVARGPVSLLVYVAEARGFFAKEGVDVRQVACTSGKECLKLLRDGAAAFATCADLLVALDGLAAEGPAVRILATISTSSSQIKVVGRSSAGIRAPADIVGKRVGTVRGSSAQYLLHLWLTQHRIEASAIREVHALAPELAPMFLRRSVDALVIWEPVAAEVTAQANGDVLALPSRDLYSQQFVIVGRRARQATGPDPREAKVLRALRAAQEYVEDYPERAGELLAARLGLPSELAQKLFAEHDYRLRLDTTLERTLARQVRWAVGQRLAGPSARPFAVTMLIDAAPLSVVMPGAVTLSR